MPSSWFRPADTSPSDESPTPNASHADRQASNVSLRVVAAREEAGPAEVESTYPLQIHTSAEECEAEFEADLGDEAPVAELAELAAQLSADAHYLADCYPSAEPSRNRPSTTDRLAATDRRTPRASAVSHPPPIPNRYGRRLKQALALTASCAALLAALTLFNLPHPLSSRHLAGIGDQAISTEPQRGAAEREVAADQARRDAVDNRVENPLDATASSPAILPNRSSEPLLEWQTRGARPTAPYSTAPYSTAPPTMPPPSTPPVALLPPETPQTTPAESHGLTSTTDNRDLTFIAQPPLSLTNLLDSTESASGTSARWFSASSIELEGLLDLRRPTVVRIAF